ncbi:hypothetical protein ACQPXS_37580 [Streptomyces sp. CA-142005]|uniref:hypothetical protein n=1 Tax=Streptomyces sp. CA-142005 TaxID=3240052 RepID=UPI003D94A6C6
MAATLSAEADSSARVIAPVPLKQVPEVVDAMERLGLGRFQPDGLVGFLGRNDNWAGRTTDGLEVFVEAGRGPSCGGARPFRRVCAFNQG